MALAGPALADAPKSAPVVREATSTSQIQAAGDAPRTARAPKDPGFRHADLARPRFMKVCMSTSSEAPASARQAAGRRLSDDARSERPRLGPCPSPRPNAINLPHGMSLSSGSSRCAQAPQADERVPADPPARHASGASQPGATNQITPALIGAGKGGQAVGASAATNTPRPGALFGPHAPRARATANAVPN